MPPSSHNIEALDPHECRALQRYRDQMFRPKLLELLRGTETDLVNLLRGRMVYRPKVERAREVLRDFPVPAREPRPCQGCGALIPVDDPYYCTAVHCVACRKERHRSALIARDASTGKRPPKPKGPLAPCPTCGGARKAEAGVTYCVPNRCPAAMAILKHAAPPSPDPKSNPPKKGSPRR